MAADNRDLITSTLDLELDDPNSVNRVSSNVEQEQAEPKLSKNALKRLAKKEKWEATKKFKRKLSREKRKGRQREFSRKELKNHKMGSSACKVGVVIDLSFEDQMSEKDVNMCIKQICRCYSVNRRQVNPLQFHVTSFKGETAKIMEKHDGFTNWDVYFNPASYDEVFDKKSVVYLTSDSENALENLEDDKLYIIGGLVDHNSKKGLCHRLAVEKGISHARLPIDKFLSLKTRKVLTINHVFEIIASVCGGLTWQDALLRVIPTRKNPSLKEDCNESEENAAGVDVNEVPTPIKSSLN